jgi:phage-related protein
VIRAWPSDIRFHIGGDLQHLDDLQQPLDFDSMGNALSGVYQLRDRDANRWYRVLYVHLEGLV